MLSRTSRGAREIRHFLIAQVWAFVLCLPALTLLSHPGNRYLLFWSATSAAIHFACVAGLGGALYLSMALLRQMGPKAYSRTITLMACVLLAGEALTIWNERWLLGAAMAHAYSGSMIVGLICLPLAAWRWRWTTVRTTLWLERASLFLLPLLPIYWTSLFMAPVFDFRATTATSTEGPRVPSTAIDGDVYVLILDAWSYRLTYREGDIASELPHLKAAASQMCSFSDAHAPGCNTFMSLPRFLFQRDDDFVLRGNETGFWNGSFTPCRGLASVFRRPREAGYRTYFVGWYHPYEVLLKDEVDAVFSSNAFRWLGQSPFEIGLQFYHEAAAKLLDRSLLGRLSGEALYKLNHVFVHNTDFVMSHMRRIVESPLERQFAVFHIPVPHPPFCYSAEGPRPLERPYPQDSVELAREQLVYTDRILGEIFERLKALGKYERATLVLTSDHTWRNDPELPARSARHWSHVPLLVKFPGQKERIQIDTPFTTSRLEDLLESVRAVSHDLSRLPRILSAESFHVTISDKEADLSQAKPLLK